MQLEISQNKICCRTKKQSFWLET